MSPNLTMFLRATRGAPITLLFAMLLLRRATGVAELESLTGYDPKTVRSGLRTLADLHLAESKDSRYNRWYLTAQGRQLPLSGLAALDDGDLIQIQKNESEGEFFPLAGSSSGSFKDSMDESVDSEQLPLLEPGKGNFSPSRPEPRPKEPEPLSPAVTHLADLLIARCGCPRRTAEKAAADALDGETDPAAVEAEALRWLAYCLSEHAAGIHSKGHFIAAKLSAAEPCPEWFQPAGDLADEIRELEQAPIDLCVFCGEPAIPGPHPPQCANCFEGKERLTNEETP